MTADGMSLAKIYGDTSLGPRPVGVDTITRGLVTVDYAHHEIHDGDFFMFHDVITLGDTVVQDYWAVTPNTSLWAHAGHMIESTGPLTLEIFEGADRTSAKTEQTCFNRNRNSANTNTTKIYKNNATGVSSGGTTDGTKIVWWKGGSGTGTNKNGTVVGTSNEKILKQNTNYILRITSNSANNLIALSFDWYEHMSKT